MQPSQKSTDQLLRRITYLQTLLKSHSIPFQQQPQPSTTAQFQPQPQSPPPPTQPSSLPPPPPPPLPTNLLPHHLPRPSIQRYSRQMLLPQIQYTGQLKLTDAKIAIIGCGGVGCPLAMYLAGAGVGTIGLFDSDKVELNNLHRQIGHTSERIGMLKTESLRRTVLSLNPNVTVNQHPFVTIETLAELTPYTLVLDGSDSAKCRYLVNDYCMKTSKLLISGACIGWQGQITAYGGTSPCYRCIWGDNEISQGGCAVRGVVGMLPGIVAMVMAVEALKLLVSGNTDLFGNLVLYDGRRNVFRKVKLRNKKVGCIGCGENRLDIATYNYAKYDGPCSTQPPTTVPSITWQAYLSNSKPLPLLLDVRPQGMYNIVHFKNSLSIPYQTLKTLPKQKLEELLTSATADKRMPEQTFVSCRRGNDSRRAVEYLNSMGIRAVNVQGGIEEYGRGFDGEIPSL